MTIAIIADLKGQEFNQDSLLQVLMKELPEDKQTEFNSIYDSASEQDKAFLLFLLSMPTSSKEEQIENITSNFTNIITLKKRYSEITPKNHIIYIEFNPPVKFLKTEENIDLKISFKGSNDESEINYQQWNLDYDSPELDSILQVINWNQETLNEIKGLLNNANCISIKNGEPTTIGFARSGMGKYSYKIFGNNLTPEQVEKYNDGCTYIFLNDNIVLEYGGGATGPQCFPDE